jgi:hypothetical protein
MVTLLSLSCGLTEFDWRETEAPFPICIIGRDTKCNLIIYEICECRLISTR